MYLEISHRQSGKTSRLINQIYRDKLNYDIQILMGINFTSLKFIKSQIKGNVKVKICLSYDSVRSLINENDNKKIRLYVDEFMYSNSFSNNFHEFMNNYHNLINDGYFTSSLNSNRSNILRDLQELNNGRCLTVNEINKCML